MQTHSTQSREEDMSEAVICLGGAALGAIVVTAVIVRWPGLVFLKRGDE